MKNKVEFLKGISDFLEQNLVCKKHKLEHTGKNIYSITIDLKLYKLTKDEKYFQRAKTRVEHTLKRLQWDDELKQWFFYPGNKQVGNCSNTVLDNGSCIDCLSEFYLQGKEKISNELRKNILDAIEKVCDTYLEKEVVEKDVTNRRLWGATGLVKAYLIFKKPQWRQALLKSLAKSIAEQNKDGSFFYHLNPEKKYPEKEDITTFYHSRHIAFIQYILEILGEDLYKNEIKKGIDYLIAITQPDGIKNLKLETKRWYWASPYEIASNAFDVYSLIKAYDKYQEEIYLEYAFKNWEQVLKHQLKDGGITSHLNAPRENFQCRVFWNGHLAWLTRVIDNIPEKYENKNNFNNYFPQASVVKYENNNYTAIWRGSKKPMSTIWGTSVGGSLIYFSKLDVVNNFILRPRLTKFFTKNKNYAFSFVRKNFRDEIFRSYLEFKGDKYYLALKKVFIAWRGVMNNYLNIYNSAWTCDAKMSHENNNVSIVSSLSNFRGEAYKGIELKRKYTMQPEEIQVQEKLLIKKSNFKNIDYLLNSAKIKDLNFYPKSGILHKDKIRFKKVSDKIIIKYTLQ